MSIKVRELSSACSAKLHVYEEMTNFVQECEKQINCFPIISPVNYSKELPTKLFDKLHFEVELIEAGYYQEKNACYGYYGCSGPSNTPENSEKKKELKPYEKETECLEISLNTTLTKYNSMKTLIDSIKITPGGRGNIHQACRLQTTPRYKNMRIGLYKKEFFHEGFEVMKKIHPDITEKDFAIYGTKPESTPTYIHDYIENDIYNRDFTEEIPYKGREGCIMIREERHSTGEVDESIFIEFSIITSDLERNTDLLIDILIGLL